MKAYFGQTPFDYSQDLSLPQPKYSRRSSVCTHSRSSSETTVVCAESMAQSPATASMLATPPQPRFSMPAARTAAVSPHAMAIAFSFKAHMGAAASPMSIPTDHNTPATAAFGYRRRRDSVISDMVSDCGSSDDEDAGAESDDEYLIPTPASLCANAGSQDEDCLFDMDADRSQRLPMSQPLDPKALTYRHMGKPEPWTVRPMECFNAHQAQVKAIDEDDNEFYL